MRRAISDPRAGSQDQTASRPHFSGVFLVCERQATYIQEDGAIVSPLHARTMELPLSSRRILFSRN